MEKVIKIGKQSVKLSNNISWAMEYRDQFGKDIVQEHIPMLASITEMLASLVDENTQTISVADILRGLEGRSLDIMLPLMQTEFMDIIISVTWAMAKTADETIDPPKQWVKQFDEFPLDVVAPTIYEMALKGMISSKNWKRLMTLKKTIQPLHSTQLSSPQSNED